MTCGDLDGKPCALLCDRRCPRSGLLPGNGKPSAEHLACAPMVALVEARARVAELENDRGRLIIENDCVSANVEHQRQHKKELESDRDCYKRAAEALSRVLGTYSQRIADGKPIDINTHHLRTAEAWLRWALERCEDPNCPFCIPVGVAVRCTTCGKIKNPVGRAAPLEMCNSLCDHECPGYRLDPKPGDLWPGEKRSDFEGEP